MNIEEYVRKVREAAKYIRDKIDKKPNIAIILGSGLGKIADNLKKMRFLFRILRFQIFLVQLLLDIKVNS